MSDGDNDHLGISPCGDELTNEWRGRGAGVARMRAGSSPRSPIRCNGAHLTSRPANIGR